ncbi:MAG: winged helix-turn-helix domain-containing protein [Treponema sp.]|jgi:transposase|nr:winged helix-turn-helix domain-containing protein [Treponema sp.]
MEKQDGRKLSKTALEERRRTIIRMKENGCRPSEIVATTGCSRQAIYLLWNDLKKTKNKEKTITVKKCGRPLGYGRTLTKVKEKELQKILIAKYPDQLKLDFALWTREAVKLVIQQKYGIDIPIRTVGEYLKRWGYTPQKPVRYGYTQDGEPVKAWFERTYPELHNRVKAENGDIYWSDEATIKGEKKEHAGIVSAITNQGKGSWKLHEGSITAEKFKDFVQRLIYGKKRKVFLVLDDAKMHHNKKLTEWVEKNKQRIELCYVTPTVPS